MRTHRTARKPIDEAYNDAFDAVVRELGNRRG